MIALADHEYWQLPRGLRKELDAWLREIGVFDEDDTTWLASITIGEGFVDTVEQAAKSGELVERRVLTKIAPPRQVLSVLAARKAE